MIKKIALSLTSLLIFSCAMKGDFKGVFSYYDKTKSEKPKLIVEYPDKPPCEIKKSGIPEVILTDGERLRDCLFQYENAIIYVWSPKCHGSACAPIELVQDHCRQRNEELFVVAAYYDTEHMDRNYTIDHPIFGIDPRHYRTNFTDKYCEKFLFDLTGTGEVKGNFLRFKKGRFVRSSVYLKEI